MLLDCRPCCHRPPLIDEYRRLQLDILGKTFFDDRVRSFNRAVEVRVDELVGQVEGAIICQNALDHCDDPMTVILRISEYAAPGCYLLLSTDIWHLRGLDAGHRNITRLEASMDMLLHGAGFDIIKLGKKTRDPGEYLQYVVLARKRDRSEDRLPDPGWE